MKEPRNLEIQIKHLTGAKYAPSADNPTEIDDDTPIVRYMKLSTLLLLLADRVFLPSLRCLQSDDQLEGLVPQTVWPNYGTYMAEITAPFENWLLERARTPKVIRREGQNHNAATLWFLAKTWLEQLSIRRCVWCWNKHTGQSHALWKIYGHRGVAVVSTVGEVKRALTKAGPLRGIVSSIDYSMPATLDEHQLGAGLVMIQKENRAFPYLFKDPGYKYEEEIRFVVGVHPDLLADARGIMVEIDGKSIVKNYVNDLWIAPGTPREEQTILRKLVKGLREGVYPDFQFDTEQDEERQMRFATVGSTPFTMADDPPDLFTDLD